jgi:hypothetical protein
MRILYSDDFSGTGIQNRGLERLTVIPSQSFEQEISSNSDDRHPARPSFTESLFKAVQGSLYYSFADLLNQASCRIISFYYLCCM